MAVAATITCPACRKTVRGAPELDGKKVRCPACQHVFVAQLGVTLKIDPGAAASPEVVVDFPIGTESETTPATHPLWQASAAGGSNADPNLTPLLDMVLQLIMFFMITANFVQTEALNEEVLLPAAQAAAPLDQTAEDYIFLNMNKQGKLVGYLEDLNNEAKLKAYLMREAEARRRLAEEKGRKGEVNIVIVLRAHKQASYGDIWRVLDICQKAGYKRWQLRVLQLRGQT
jgi:biopolymer transport protein ExbD